MKAEEPDIEISLDLLKQYYHELNELCFDGKLPNVKLQLQRERFPYAQVKYTKVRDEYRVVHISISRSYYYTESLLKRLLLHEMTHVYLLGKKQSVLFDHGFHFQLMAWKFKFRYGMSIWASSLDMTKRTI